MVAKRLNLTIPQMDAVLSHQKRKYLEWGRGAGKSFILAYFMREFAKQMPRGSFFLVGETFTQILSRTLPGTIRALELFGLYQDVDFVVGTCGKSKGFAMPLYAPQQWKNIIHFSNGAVFFLVSLDNQNSGRGLNSFGGIGDEAALLDPIRLFNNVQTTNRAKEEIYDGVPLLGAEIYASSTPMSKSGMWFVEMEEKALERPDKYYFSSAPATTNHMLRPDYFESAKENSPTQTIYEAEILNIRPKVISDGFYANLNDKIHYYSDYDQNYLEGAIWLPKEKRVDIAFNCKQDNDVIRTQGLIVSLDFGVFNSIVISQLDKASNTYRVLKSFWVKSPKITNDLFIEEFLPYYEPHQEKKIYLYGGHDGHNRQANSTSTLYQQLETLLRAHGWQVYVMAKPSAPLHSRKYILLNSMLKGIKAALPKIRINKDNNKDLIIALERAEAIEGKTGIEKQKKDERNKKMMQQHTTHLTDAFDYPLYDMFWQPYESGSHNTAGEGLIMLR